MEKVLRKDEHYFSLKAAHDQTVKDDDGEIEIEDEDDEGNLVDDRIPGHGLNQARAGVVEPEEEPRYGRAPPKIGGLNQ